MQIVKPAVNVGIVARDIDPMLEFYGVGLGLEKLDQVEAPPTPDGRTRVAHIYRLGEGQLKLWALDPTPAVSAPVAKMGRSGLSYLTVTVSGLTGLIEGLTSLGYPIAEPPHPAASGAPLTLAWITDPDGNWIELVEPRG